MQKLSQSYLNDVFLIVTYAMDRTGSGAPHIGKLRELVALMDVFTAGSDVDRMCGG